MLNIFAADNMGLRIVFSAIVFEKYMQKFLLLAL